MKCSRCGQKRGYRDNPLCKKCTAWIKRAGGQWKRPLSAEQRLKDIARSYAGVYKRRGVLLQQKCEKCGSPNTEMHHEDYDKPLDVKWFCRPCHMDEHGVSVRSHVKHPLFRTSKNNVQEGSIR